MKKRSKKGVSSEAAKLRAEIKELRAQLREAKETLEAIRKGEVDALVVGGPEGERVFTLKSAEQVYRFLVEQMQEGAATCTPSGMILYANRRLAALLKMPIERLFGAELARLVPPAEWPGLSGMLQKVAAGVLAFVRVETSLQAADGTSVPVYLSANVIRPEDGAILGLVATDLTERKRAEEALQRSHDELEERVKERTAELGRANAELQTVNQELEVAAEELHQQNDELAAARQALEVERRRYMDLFTLAPDGYVVTDPHGLILEANGTAAALLGVAEGFLTGKPLTVFLAAAEHASLFERLAALRSGTAVPTWETVLRARDGTQIPVAISLNGVFDASGKPQTLRWLFRDITARKQTERERLEVHQRLQALMSAAPVGISVSDDATCQRITGNAAVLAQFEATPEDNLSASAPDASAQGRSVRCFLDGREITAAEFPLKRAVAENREIPPMELEVALPSGRRWIAQASAAPVRDAKGNVVGGVAVTLDITEQKRAEERLRANVAALTRMHALSGRLLDAGGLQPLLQETMDAAIAITGAERGTLQLLEGNALRIVAHRGHERPFLEYFASAEGVKSVCGETMKRKERVVVPDIEASPLFAGSPSLAVLREAGVRAIQSTPMISRSGAFLGVLTTHWGEVHCPDEHDLWRLDLLARQATDLIEYAKADQALRESQALIRAVMDGTPDPIFVKDRDSRVLMANEALAKVAGKPIEEIIGKTDGEYYGDPAVGQALHENDLRVMASGKGLVAEETVPTPDGERTFLSGKAPLRDASGNIIGIVGISHDVTDRKRAEEALQESADDLARSNADLEQFAYVASHDLQEPLRMVTGYMQLLKQRYADKLDADAGEFIAFAVDGAARMSRLINDLLAYSRVGTRGQELQPADSDRVLRDVLATLQLAIEDNHAVVTHDPLPIVRADATQLPHLFQNLIANAIKFRGQEPPRIHVGARPVDDMWEFSVSDNGIGMDMQHRDRIFMVFQRLHTREAYAGTGIGLAICKKIVERHGGRIWVESKIGQGSTFYFTLPKADDSSH